MENEAFSEYLSMIMALQWYIFLRKEKQIDEIFDKHFKTNFEGIYIPYIKEYKKKMKQGLGYDLVLQELQEIEKEKKNEENINEHKKDWSG
jgi:hypothetical protein